MSCVRRENLFFPKSQSKPMSNVGRCNLDGHTPKNEQQYAHRTNDNWTTSSAFGLGSINSNCSC